MELNQTTIYAARDNQLSRYDKRLILKNKKRICEAIHQVLQYAIKHLSTIKFPCKDTKEGFI